MARPPKGDINLDVAVNLTVPLIERLSCPPGSEKAFLKDAEVQGLKVRVTAAGSKSYVFMMKVGGRTMTRTIGAVSAWSIPTARAAARNLRVLLDQKKDPRELDKQAQAEKEKADALAVANTLTVGDVWPRYLQEGKPKRRDSWKPGYLDDLKTMSSPGGEPKKRGAGLTRPGVIYPLLALALVDVNEDTLKTWFDREAKTSKHQAARGLMMFRGFLRWCAGQSEYKRLVDRDAGRAPAILDNLPKNKRRVDALEADQVRGWWLGVEQLGNRTASAYLRTLLLTGARREEIAAMRWDDVDFQWRKLTIADKVDLTRTIPLGPYLAQMLATLPRVGPYVFASASMSGRIADARNSHATALTAAGIDHLTIHGLRRSFSLLGEASGAPAGAIAQIQGHKPSATAEGYKPRTIDALRPYLHRIEEHILSVAGVQFDPKAEPGKLRAVA
ncbi:MAG: tyrosine-type recombinase/integrase [Limnohabitans sp.]